MKKKKTKIEIHPKKLSISPTLSSKPGLYERDFYKWIRKQAMLLKKNQLSELDTDNLIEEIESLGRNDKRALRSQMIRLLMHLLKQKYQPEKDHSNSWTSSINDATREINFIIQDSPSLKNELIKFYPEAYAYARVDAAKETKKNIKIFPEESPWAFDELFPELIKKSKHKSN